MKLGIFSIWTAFVSAAVSAVLYYLSPKDNRRIAIARTSFYVMTGAVLVSSFYLIYLILTHHFEVSYVCRYSSSELPTFYLISSFWAGQEGTFLLWAVFTAVMGIVFIRRSEAFESFGMVCVNIFQLFLLFLLIQRSPFQLLPETPSDGAGLNPLLQDPWMVVHPPILFMGYAALTFPFAIALSALVEGRYGVWIRKALPWALFASLTLGAGIIIGGYWAYEVLGWGGYWGWDPVENSSLVPWLTTLALVHGLLVQKNRGALQRTNLFLAIVSFLLVIYATFLTRSGVLADFSVHSFEDFGLNAPLLIFMIGISVLSISLFIWRFKTVPSQSMVFRQVNRENVLFISMTVLCASAFLILVGTSAPIITGISGSASKVESTFYGRMNLPLAILMGFLLGINPLLMWTQSDSRTFLKRIYLPVMLAVLSVIAGLLAGVNTIAMALFTGASAFAFWSNVTTFVRTARAGVLLSGGPMAHLGVALLFIGIIGSSVYDTSERVMLRKDVAQQGMGYDLIYRGQAFSPDGKAQLRIEVNDGKSSYNALPRFYYSEYTKGTMKTPDIRKSLLADLYISPLELIQDSVQAGTKLLMRKGETKEYAAYVIQFLGFDMASHGEAIKAIRIGANLRVTYRGKDYDIQPTLLIEGGERKPLPATIPESNTSVMLSNINADERMIELIFQHLDTTPRSASENVVIEISRKPLMNLLWIGTLCIMLGVFLGVMRRAGKSELVD